MNGHPKPVASAILGAAGVEQLGSSSKAAGEERTHGHRCGTHHRRARGAKVLSRGLA